MPQPQQAQRPPEAKPPSGPSRPPAKAQQSAADGEPVRLAGSDDDTPLLDLLVKYKAGEVEWDEVVEFAGTYELTGRKDMVEVGYHNVEDEFPQAGTLDEVLAADLEDDEVDELYALLAPEETAPKDEPEEDEEEEPEAE